MTDVSAYEIRKGVDAIHAFKKDHRVDDDDVPRKQLYDGVIGTVDKQTGGYQPPFVRQEPIIAQIGYPKYRHQWVRDALLLALRDGKLCRTQNPETGDTILGINDADVLREKVSSYAERRKEPRADLIGIAYRRISQLEEEADDE